MNEPSSFTPEVTLTREQLQDWLAGLRDYGCGRNEYWVPTKEAFEALCKLGLSALSEKKEILIVDDGHIDPALLARLVNEQPSEIVAVPSAIEQTKVVWELHSKTTSMLFASREAAQKYLAGYPVSVTGGFDITERFVCE